MSYKDKKSIILTGNAYYPNIGGVENSLRHLAKSYLESGYHVDILVGNTNTVSEYVLPEYEVIEGISVYRFGAYGKWAQYPFINTCARLYDMAKKFRKISGCNTLAVISRYHDTTLIAKLSIKLPVLYLIPGVVREQNKAINTFQSKSLQEKFVKRLKLHIHDTVQKLAFCHADVLLAFSNNMKQQVETCLNGRQLDIKLTKPGVDSERFQPIDKALKQPLRASLELPCKGTLLLGVGRLVRAKGFHYLIEALLYSESCSAIILGDGPEKETLQHLAEELKVADRVIFKGGVNNPELYYQASDIFVMTSVYEPLGQIVLEALASGLPIVAFSKNAMPQTSTEELLSHEECVFVEHASAYHLGEGINRLVADKNQRESLSRRGRERAKSSYSWPSLAKELRVVAEQIQL
ncbi:glycosyltransferase family 4 protein [Pseudoalteromonas holothuriae]|uniref:glycosyltransferase family 4 protein n=1 Tax=Pseudoalteromonas holothuriae TaxID=2963714 RepID=UPI0021C0D52A|nr:glycosyltransferase family 4 protein [Pseudoalteromonas sp. CIP111951]